MSQKVWNPPVLHQHKVVCGSTYETTPFIWKDRLYVVENFHRASQFPGKDVQHRFHEDGCYIRDVEQDLILSYPWLNHYFSTVNVFQDKLILVGGDYEFDRPWWHIRHLQMMTSDDLTTWSKPVTILEAEEGENLFNNAIVFDGEKYVLCYETDDPRFEPKFTFRYAISHDLVHWEKLPEEYVYGVGKYVGAPGLYYVDGWYYQLYLGETNFVFGHWSTRIARSRDLKNWEDAPLDRPVLKPDETRETDPVNNPGKFETNASDLELLEWNNKVYLWWNGGNQQGTGDSQSAYFNGSLKEYLEYFFR